MGNRLSDKPVKKIFNLQEFLLDVFSDKYVLIIGSGAILNVNYGEGDVNKHLLEKINSERGNSTYKHFNQIPPLNDYNLTHPLHTLLTDSDWASFFNKEKISSQLINFLTVVPFRIILTTTIDSFIVKALEEVWGENEFEILSFRIRNNDDFNTLCKAIENVKFGKQTKPILFYLFGKAEADYNCEYVKNDDDAIQFIAKWMGIMQRTNNFVSYLKSRKILALGCKYNDWYFRFFWFIMNGRMPNATDEGIYDEGQVVFQLNNADNEERKLENFINSKRATYLHNMAISDFLKEVVDGFSEDKIWDLIKKKRQLSDVFISYKSVNKEDAIILFSKLVQEGFRVWLDDEGLIGSNDIDDTIKTAIHQAKVFIVLLTPDVANDLPNWDNRYYVKEWNEAKQWNQDNHIRIIPLAINGYRFDTECHKKFQEIICATEPHGYDLYNSILDWNRLINDIKKQLINNK